MFIHCFKTILVFQWILQSCDGVLVSQENSQVAIQSDKKVDLPISPTSLHNFLQVFLSVFLWFYFHLFHLVCCIRPRKRVVVVPPPISCSAGGVSVGSAFEAQHSTFTKGFAQGGKTWSWSRNPRVKNFAPFLKSDLKGNGLGCIQLIETVVFVNTPCKQTVFLFQTNIYTTEVWQQKPLKKWCLEDWSGFRLGVFVGLFSGANSC